ncbi:ATP-dependent RNA helicase DbpA [Sulfurimonas autotrophica]|uniref:ATP-dependent RNA helicase DbpA n=1 Tax=Sulfurimonas autotrophica (strain ATCC BAA-671 / DSM 16294 / JCM 11897 / OK10) TaxID=563040 RepID=E0URV8_SULAO|nr:ATP-dependent RNA helicase DbpA [Sulfurimonas autotrophica]ADN10122.1 ATP-dependent RNA helicase DbpA [Sulfurimonas autotrophica DSM 16294]
MNFATLPLSPQMLQTIESLGYKEMTPIQAQSLPSILEGRDIIAQAKTGSGKTAAFGIGLLHHLNVKKFRVQSLVLCPTRELADQVAKELRRLARFQHNIKILMLSGGESFGRQLGSLAHQAHIIVGTPGRVLKHLNKESLELSNLNTLVFDEADRMLDMGFIEEIESVLAFVPKERQTLLFSATYDDEILQISKRIQNNALHVKTAAQEVQNKIVQEFYETNDKVDTLIKILANYKPENVIVFTNTKLEAKELAESLVQNKIDALAIHGDLEQYERNDVLVQFANKSCPVLVATDVAARGLDIKDLSMVVNYDLPHSMETYTHRIGRTGRAGAEGIAVTLYNEYEAQKIEPYEEDEKHVFLDASALKKEQGFEMKPQYVTLVIEGGKKDKIRAGDILGALTGDAGLQGSSIGKIDLYDRQSYVAIENSLIDEAYKKLKNGKIKNRKFSVWVL